MPLIHYKGIKYKYEKTPNVNLRLLFESQKPGISSITIDYLGNSQIYYEDTDLFFPYDSSIKYDIDLIEGYDLNIDQSNELILSRNMILSPIATIKMFNINITIGEGIDNVVFRFDDEMIGTTGQPLRLTKPYNTSVSYQVTYELGYVPVGNSLDTFLLKNDVDLFISGKLQQFQLSLTIDEYIESVTINGTQYYSSQVIIVYYGDIINWSAIAKPEYRIDGDSSGSFNVYRDMDLQIKSRIDKPIITIEINEGISYIYLTIQSDEGNTGKVCRANEQMVVEKKSHITWSATLTDAYRWKFTSESSGELGMNGEEIVDTVISPTAAKI